jgi:hypothetical protein
MGNKRSCKWGIQLLEDGRLACRDRLDILMSRVYAPCMRTTVRLNDDLLAAAKQRAAADHTTLTALIEDSLRLTLALRPMKASKRLEVKPLGDAVTLPGVDLDDSVSLRDLMDGLR